MVRWYLKDPVSARVRQHAVGGPKTAGGGKGEQYFIAIPAKE